jgi:hypothetical protein
MKTYYILENTFREAFPSVGMPEDFALFDGSLYINYDGARKTVSFDILSPEEAYIRARIFARIDNQTKNGLSGPFTVLDRPVANVPNAKDGPALAHGPV